VDRGGAGDFCWGSPQSGPTNPEDIAGTYGFIPLSGFDIIQVPENWLPEQILWGRHSLGEDQSLCNFNSFRIPVLSCFNIEKICEMAAGYWDAQIYDFLRFGFPLDVGAGFHPSAARYNHASAVNFPIDIKKYIDTELKYGALIGPIDTSHFDFIHFSLFMLRPKDADSRRVMS
jgi:hypothetical protein